MLENFTQATFANHVGEKFRINLESSDPLELELINVTDLASGEAARDPKPGRQEPFSLLFCGPAQPLLPQQIYPFEHSVIGKFEMFIVPIGPNQDGMLYEAVFN